jgi:hypothetical protein
MITSTGNKTERKQTSRGQRKHVRRMKQEARRVNIPDNVIKGKKRTSEALKE